MRSEIVNVFAMTDADDEHDEQVRMDFAQDAVIANSPAPHAMKIATERFAKPPWIA